MSEFNNLVQSDEIKLLKFPECVRMRPGMYISGVESTDTLLREILDNCIDEAYIAADTIIVDRDMNGYIMVSDNGRGISIEYSKELKDGQPVIQADLSISALHSGSKFSENKNATVGANGAGSACVNAVSENYILLSRITPLNFDKSTKEVYELWNSVGPRSKKDLFYVAWYKKGYKYYEGALKKSDVEKMLFSGSKGKKKSSEYKELPTGMSTIVLFQPDPEVFVGVTAKPEIPVRNLQYFLLIMEKYYKRKVTIDIEGTVFTSADFNRYQFEFTKQIIPEDTSANEKVDVYVTFEVDTTLGNRIYNGSVNSLSVDSGVHVSYVENCFIEALKTEFGIKHKYLTNGLRLCVVILASELIFNSQTKEKLKAITKVKPSDFAPIIKEFQKIFRKNSDYWSDYVSKLNLYAESMRKIGAAEKAQKMIDAASGNQVYRNKSGFIDSFSDATATGPDRWNCELFICFTGDTEILTCNNERINFVDLTRRIEAGEDIYTFSCTSDGRIVPAKIIRSEIKKEVNNLCKITLDNGEVFKCTLDHKIMMRDGTYKEAKDLLPEDSLMPCYITLSDNYDGQGQRRVVLDMSPGDWKKKYRPDEFSMANKGTLRPIFHVMAEHKDVNIDESSIGAPKVHRHHIDKNKDNDYPTNILLCSEEKHFSFHCDDMSKLAHEKAHEDPEIYRKMYVDNKRTESFKKNASEAHRAVLNGPDGDRIKNHLREKAIEEWSSEELRKWRSEETKKYAKEHPDWAKANSKLAKISYWTKSVIPEVEKYINANNLEFNSKSYNLAVLNLTIAERKNWPTYDRLINYVPELKDKFPKVSNDSIDYLRAETVLECLRTEGQPVSVKTFNDKFIELFEKPLNRKKVSSSHRGAYLYTKKHYPELLSKYEAELNGNHKVVSVEFLEVDNEPVYCLEVDAAEHNFPLAAGVFVKNCEGRSPWGSLKAGRKDARHIACLGLRGKVLNTTDKTADEMLRNSELESIFKAIGLGLDVNNVTSDCQTPEEAYQKIVEKSRYGKINIAVDADSDGSQIANLLIYAFSKYARFLLDFGLVYYVLSPIYEQAGKYYYANDPRTPGTDFPVGLDPKKPYHRYKGLTI